MTLPFFIIVPNSYSKSVQESEFLKNQYSLPCVFLSIIGLVHTHKNVLVCNFATDYNLESIKMKSNIYIKNEHYFLQWQIALAKCRQFSLLICNRHPIPSRKEKGIQKEDRSHNKTTVPSTYLKTVLTAQAS